ncbi:DUF3883 domain-containing protein [Paraclostridium bifermentans]|uniref:DUF3883 domain-containing protein n=1 Tax=Paraclostridium bifermentans TaxID=1490 RepID=UPI0011DE49FA|nr:DUF3883 domain-containing protein [Paraclostridium bifermentans]
MKNENIRHLFIGYNSNYEDTDIDTMEEHIKIDEKKGEVIWGQFTTHQNQHKFQQTKIKKLDEQVKFNIPTLVFFHRGKGEGESELYCAEYIGQYGRKDIGKDIIDLVPKYYHDRVNSDPIPGKFTCKAYVRVKNIKKIDISNLERIYQFEEPFNSIRYMNSIASRPKTLLYTIIDQELYSNCCSGICTYDEDYEEIISEENIEKIDNSTVNISVSDIEGIFVEAPKKECEREHSNKSRQSKGIKTDYIKKAKSDKKLGEEGELFVIKVEKARLENLGVKNYEDKIEHVSLTKGDGLGYDIKSIDIDEFGNEVTIYIEVKTTTNKSIKHPFFISKKEIEVSKEKTCNGERYLIYRVYDFDINIGKGKIYIEEGSVLENFNCTPEVYKAYR